MCSYGNQEETSLSNCGHTSTHLGILIAEEVEEKEEVLSCCCCYRVVSLLLLSFGWLLPMFYFLSLIRDN